MQTQLPEVTLNETGVFYLLDNNRHCGVNFADRNLRVVCDWLNISAETIPEKGTPAHYHYYELMMKKGAEYAQENNVRCETYLKQHQLHKYVGCRVEVETMYGEVRRFNVGKSTGWLPTYLEVKTARSMGGCAVEQEYKSIKLIRRIH